MLYREVGRTGIKISRLGMGCMRLPLAQPDNWKAIDREQTARMVETLIAGGVNYFDTAYGYHEGESETVMGEILEPYRDRLYLSTKSPGWLLKEPGDVRRFLEEQLRKLRVSTIDFYHLHGINLTELRELDQKYQWVEQCQAFKAEGLIKHLSFSFHGPAEDLSALARTGSFDSVLCQYSLLDLSNQEGITQAAELGLGVMVMGPVAGGRIARFGPSVIANLNISPEERARFALQFVWSNPKIDCALSGMSSLEQVKANLQAEASAKPFGPDQQASIVAYMSTLAKMGEKYCTGCRYCLPCPQKVAIPFIFELKIYHDVYGMTEYAQKAYRKINTSPLINGRDAAACVECGECETRCPNKIPIIQQLKECRVLFE